MRQILENLTHTVTNVHGDAGREWLQRLPSLIDECAARWNLTLGSPFASSYNYVAPAGANAVLKIGVPCRELDTEIEALRLFDGRGSARLIHADINAGALVIERVTPGQTLELAVPDDEAAAREAAAVMRDLWRPPPPSHALPSVGDWLRAFHRHRLRFDGGTGPLNASLFEKAESLARDLLASPEPVAVLHGDLHHGNILSARRAPFLAIDPKGIVGEPAFEPSAFLLNPHPVSMATLARRVAIFAEALGFDRERVRAWGLVRAVMSACWTIEDNGDDFESAMMVASRLS